MEHSPQGFRVPKLRVTVELVLMGGERRDVELFVAGQRANAPTRQYVIDLLAGDESFLPARSDDGMRLYNKDNLLWVAIDLSGGEVPVEEAAAEPEQEFFDVRKSIAVEFAGDRRLEGDLLYSPPPGRSRVTDYLNEISRFFRLWTPSHVFMVNKNHIESVVERSAAGGR